MKRKNLMAFFILITLMMSANSKALAYSCKRTFPLATSLKEYDLIVEGVASKDSHLISNFLGWFRDSQKINFSVTKVWKGPWGLKELIVEEPLSGGDGCPRGYGFETGKSYLVFTHLKNNTHVASAFSCTCSSSSLLNSAQAQADLLKIKEILGK